VRLEDRNGRLIIDPEPLFVELDGEPADFEDQGSRGFNYRAERFSHRLKENPDVSKIFNSEVHGDPATPIFLANPGDPVTFRFTYPADRARAHAFVIHGHSFLRSQDDVNSSIISVRGQNSIGTNDNFWLIGGAGGNLNLPGDYLYRSGNIRWDVELGVWGIFRVLSEDRDGLLPLINDPNVKVIVNDES